MIDHNQPTPAEGEALAIFAEEAAEAIQAVTKIVRHGLLSQGHPDDAPLPQTNLRHLAQEVGDLLAAIDVLRANGLLDMEEVDSYRDEKLVKLKKYTHSCKLPWSRE